ncbi:hypothetical protein ACEE21_14785 [Clostridium baratii]
MLYSKEELEKVESILDEEEACTLLNKLDNLVEDTDLPSVSDMVNDALDSYKEKSMRVSRVIYLEKGKQVGSGYAIEIETEEGYVIQSYYREENSSIPVSLLRNLLDLSCLGYKLKAYRDMQTLKFNLNGGEWNGSIS